MTQEEKAKRYDEAIERSKNYYSTTDSAADIKLIGLIFPELKESDGERIRKMLIEQMERWHKCALENNVVQDIKDSEDAIAWLEKQGEHANFRNKIKIGDKVTRNKDGVLVNLSQLNRVAKKQGEQKLLYVNDNAKEMFIKALERVEEQNNKGYKLTDCDKNSWWEDFKAYTSCIIEQKPAAWSEEDRKIIIELISIFESAVDGGHVAFPYRLIKDYIKVLKSCLPQNTWKPSEEQMKALDTAISCGIQLGTWEKEALKSLKEQLFKLKN